MELRTLAAAYDRSAAAYDEQFRPLQRVKYRAAARLLGPFLRSGGGLGPRALVLDAGAGTGLFAEWLLDPAEPHAPLRAALAAPLRAGRLLALDLSPRMVERSRARGAAALVADLARPPLRPGSCALVLSFTSLLEQVPAGLSALGALVAPGGALCLGMLAAESRRPELLARQSGLTHLLGPLEAGQDLLHLLVHPRR